MKTLILLIGDNNISNYSLIKFLKKKMDFKFDKIFLVATNKTLKSANQIMKLLDENFEIIDVEDIKEYFTEVRKRIKEKIKNFDEIVLDFTGGMKSMALGAYLAVDEVDAKDKYICYVDYSTNKIIFKRGKEYILDENLTIKEIAKVHGVDDLEYKKENSEFFSFESVEFLLNRVQNEEKVFFEDLWDKKDLKKLNWKESLKDSPINSDVSNKKLKYLQKYIKGEFLEEYIFALLNEIKKEKGIYEIAWNVKGGKEASFEVDVLASKRNKLYLFSCTTDKTKKYAKQKGFEAKEKVTQIGGKNAKAILVSCIPETQKEEIKKDLEEKKGGDIPEILVFEDLLDKQKLKRKLMEIFK